MVRLRARDKVFAVFSGPAGLRNRVGLRVPT